jgi:hypothetical protein
MLNTGLRHEAFAAQHYFYCCWCYCGNSFNSSSGSSSFGAEIVPLEFGLYIYVCVFRM